MSNRELERAIDRLADTLAEFALAKVKAALELDRGRYDSELAELRDEVFALSGQLSDLRIQVSRLTHAFNATAPEQYSVKVHP